MRDGNRVTRYFKGKAPPLKRPWRRDPRPPEALAWLDEIYRQNELGRVTWSGASTVGEHMAEWWELRRPSLGRVSTVRTEESMIRLIAADPLANMRLDALRANHVQAMLNRMLAAGKAPATVKKVRAVLSQAMKAAWDWERIPRNPVTPTSAGTVKNVRERRTWTPAEAQAFLAANQNDPLLALWMTLLYSGMRQGEARGLQWADIDFTRHTISIRRHIEDHGYQTVEERKSGPGATLPMVPALEQALRAHRARADSICRNTKPDHGYQTIDDRKSGPGATIRKHRQNQPVVIGAAKHSNSDSWVFSRRDGSFFTGPHVRYAFKAACQRAKLEPLSPHELRHTGATLMADAGVPLPTLQSIFGWATSKMLEQIYYHHSETEQRKALESLAERLSG